MSRRALSLVVCMLGCSHDPPRIPPGLSGTGFSLTEIGSAADGLASPTGLAFAPDHPDELWVVNRASNGVVIFYDPGKSTQHSEARVDRYAQHFMIAVSSLSFGDDNHFSTCQDSLDVWNLHPIPPDDYMGPTLWDANLDVFAEVGQAYPKVDGLEGSHIDMLHESPLCMGIAHDHDNVYWAFDGMNGHIVRYDFVHDHGPGGSNHSDGRVRRYPDAMVHRAEGISSQLAFDADRGLLYIADTGADRVMRLDTSVGTPAPIEVPPPMESLAEYMQVLGLRYDTLVASLPSPSGLVIEDDGVYVGSADSGEIIAFDHDGHETARISTGHPGIRGLTIGPDGHLYFVDELQNTVVRVDS
jgi:DNA-binding beta-propeller fold protein YncE